MKNFSHFIILFILFSFPLLFQLKTRNEFEVLGVKDSAHIFVDINKNSQIDDNELLTICDLVPITKSTTYTPNYNLSLDEKVFLEYKFKEWAKKHLLNKKVTITKLSDTKYLLFLYGNDYRTLALKEGFAQTTNKELLKLIDIEKIKKNLNTINTQNFVVLNIYNNKYHKLDCIIVQKLHNYIIIPSKNLPKNATPCKLCHIKQAKHLSKHKFYKYKLKKQLPASFKINNFVTAYFMNFNNTKQPYNDCKIPAAKSLLLGINSAKMTIDFAIYGINNEPQIFKALIKAQERGVKIRWVSDFDATNPEQYPDSAKLAIKLKNYNNDKQSLQKFIMHNKFFIFDNKKVWTSSANITDTDLSNFNANYALLIDSKQVANIYKQEFEQMYLGKFHNEKRCNQNPKVKLGNTELQILFSPQDKIITTAIIPYINRANSYIYIPIFYLTHKDLAQALINAKKRGIDVKIITDATNARGKYTIHTALRNAQIPVKTENKAGKMHMKAVIIDDKISILGSMNFTKSGENHNDENVIIASNSQLAKYLKSSFLIMWNSIPDKYLTKDPAAESFSSLGSCTDRIDNDFDGKIDKADEGCNFIKK